MRQGRLGENKLLRSRKSIQRRTPSKWVLTPLLLATPVLVFSGCGKKSEPQREASECTLNFSSQNTGSTGQAYAFQPDPMTASGSRGLAPTSTRLDELRLPVSLNHLGGKGVLEGTYVDIRTSQSCVEGYGAFDAKNRFVYSQKDLRFQQAMSYFHGDGYRAGLDQAGYLIPKTPVRIIAHCMRDDNAFYTRSHDQTGQVIEKVCLGDSASTPGASYADDGTVVVHELQHATTVNAYSLVQDINRFWYDEAGALNEAISDFMALTYFAPVVPSSLDPRVFSRWALGTFIPGDDGTRGANRCPVYDSSYPNCGDFKAGADGFSVNGKTTVSYHYPDGVGWPYGNNYQGPGYAKDVYSTYRSQEEIHNAGVLMAGALWDVYEALKSRRAGDAAAARMVASQLVIETLKHLPKPTLLNQSPVTFRGFAAGMLDSAALLHLSSDDVTGITDALTVRGLLGGQTVPAGWAAAGPGEAGTPTPGVKIVDNPDTLKGWFYDMGTDATVVTQGPSTGLDSKLQAGEVAAIWFDIKNTSDITAGSLLVTVTSKDPDVTFLDENFNIGAMSSSQAQIIYYKVNGVGVTRSLSTGPSDTYRVPTDATYFKTNKFFARNWTTALFVKVKPTAGRKTVILEATINASNATTPEVVQFPVEIR